MIVWFSFHQVAPLMLILDRKKLLPFHLWQDSAKFLPQAIEAAKEEKRKLCLMCNSVNSLVLCKDYLPLLEELGNSLVVVVSDTVLNAAPYEKWVKLVDVEKEKDGKGYSARMLKPSQINALLREETTTMEELKAVIALLTTATPAKAEVEELRELGKPVSLKHEPKLDRKNVFIKKQLDVPKHTLTSALRQLSESDKQLFVKVFLGETPLDVVSDEKKKKLFQKLCNKHRPKLLRVYFLLQKSPDLPLATLCKAYGVPLEDVGLLLAYS